MLRFVVIAALCLSACDEQSAAMPLDVAKEKIAKILDGMDFPQKDPQWCRDTAFRATEVLYEERADGDPAIYYTNIMRQNGCFDEYSRFERPAKVDSSAAVSVPSKPVELRPSISTPEGQVEKPSTFTLPETVAYVRLSSVRAEPVRLAQIALENARSSHFLILDLRGNYGGDLDEARAFLALFAPRFGGLIFSTTTTRKGDREYRALWRGKYADLPVAVLVDPTTASAAEVIARVLRLWGGTIIGQKTTGKGVYQGVSRLGPFDVIVTNGYTRIGEGRTAFHGEKLTPDRGLTVEDVSIARDLRNDESVRAALRHFGFVVQ